MPSSPKRKMISVRMAVSLTMWRHPVAVVIVSRLGTGGGGGGRRRGRRARDLHGHGEKAKKRRVYESRRRRRRRRRGGGFAGGKERNAKCLAAAAVARSSQNTQTSLFLSLSLPQFPIPRARALRFRNKMVSSRFVWGLMPSVISEAREEPDHDGRGEGGRRGGGTASKELCNGSQFNPREERKNERTNGGRRAMIFLRFEKQRSRAARTMAGRKEGRKERARGPQMKTVWGGGGRRCLEFSETGDGRFVFIRCGVADTSILSSPSFP